MKLYALLVGVMVICLTVASCGGTETAPSLEEPYKPAVAPTPTSSIRSGPTPTSTPIQSATLEPFQVESTPDAPVPTTAQAPTPITPLPPPAIEAFSRRTPFVPLDNPIFLSSSEATYLEDDELVLGLEFGGEARAYPTQMMWYHHIVNDTVAGQPILITY